MIDYKLDEVTPEAPAEVVTPEDVKPVADETSVPVNEEVAVEPTAPAEAQ